MKSHKKFKAQMELMQQKIIEVKRKKTTKN